MSLDTRVSQLIKRIYSAATDRSAWDSATVELFQLMGCCGGLATLVDARTGELLLCQVYTPRHSENAAFANDYVQQYPLDPSQTWRADHPDVRFCDSRQLPPALIARAHPFLQWTSSTFGSTCWYAGFASPAPGLTFCLAGHFASEITGKDGEAIKLFEIVFDHLECALRLGARPFKLASARALIRFNSDGTIEQISKGAEQLLRGRGSARRCEERLAAFSSSEQANLDRAIARVLGRRSAPSAPTAIQLQQENGRQWIAIVRPVTENFGLLGVLRQRVDVEILDQIPEVGRSDVIQSLFELTGRELQVLRLLGQGHSIDSLSAMIEVSRNTTRAHLRSIFFKTKTNSQTELMQLCSWLSNVAASDSESHDLELVN